MFFIFLPGLSGCGKNSDEKINDAILDANNALTTRQCQKAIDLLLAVGAQPENARYNQIMASAYACKADFSEPVFFGTDLPKFGSVSGSVFGGLTTFTTSKSMTSVSDDKYDAMWDAINTLLYAGGIARDKEPTPARRIAVFGTEDSLDIDTQLLYMLVAQLGKYLYFYGNVANGLKGTGTGQTNTCLLNYNEAGITAAFAGNGGVIPTGSACNGTNKGNAFLGTPGAYNLTRTCQGIILVNNILQILPNIAARITSSPQLSAIDITAMNAGITAFDAAATAAGYSCASIITTLNQINCEALNVASDSCLQYYYFFVLEFLLK